MKIYQTNRDRLLPIGSTWLDERVATEGLYATGGIGVVARSKNPHDSLGDILSEVIEPFVNAH
jgi:hypothetical protein